jgi:uncharacterized phosphosugar-binding protein
MIMASYIDYWRGKRQNKVFTEIIMTYIGANNAYDNNIFYSSNIEKRDAFNKLLIIYRH